MTATPALARVAVRVSAPVEVRAYTACKAEPGSPSTALDCQSASRKSPAAPRACSAARGRPRSLEETCPFRGRIRRYSHCAQDAASLREGDVVIQMPALAERPVRRVRRRVRCVVRLDDLGRCGC